MQNVIKYVHHYESKVWGLAWRFYSLAASTMTKSDVTSDKMLVQLAQKIRSVMKAISSDDHDSVLLDSIEHFNWETIWLELQNKMPTLIKLLELVITNSSKKKSLVVSNALTPERDTAHTRLHNKTLC